MKSATGAQIAYWSQKFFGVELSMPRVSDIAKRLDFHTLRTRATPRERLREDFVDEIEDALTRLRARILDHYELEEVLAEDEIMFWNTGSVESSYVLRGR
jgi:hypothetical protein